MNTLGLRLFQQCQILNPNVSRDDYFDSETHSWDIAALKNDLKAKRHQASIKKDMQQILYSMGFAPNYIGRALKVYKKNYGNSYDAQILSEIIIGLQNKDKSKENGSSFIRHMTLKEAMKIKVNDGIDHRDQIGRSLLATVTEKKGRNLKIHYVGWSEKWDLWCDVKKELHRFAKPTSISRRAAHRFNELKKGYYIDINPFCKHRGWKPAEIRSFDEKSGQIQVVYEYGDKKYLYWTHLDNTEEIAAFTSKSGTMNQAQIHRFKQNDNNNNNNNNGPSIEEMEEIKRIRNKRFPQCPNEKINNPYIIGDKLEVQDTKTKQWIVGTIINKENNWIVIHFDGWDIKYDQQIHAVKHKKRLRNLSEQNCILRELEDLNWKLKTEIFKDDGIYLCLAKEIYGDSSKNNFVKWQCQEYINNNKTKSALMALSELFNVRIRIFEYDREQKKLYMTADYGEYEETVNLPLILLIKTENDSYGVIGDPHSIHIRPLLSSNDRKYIATQNGEKIVMIREMNMIQHDVHKKFNLLLNNTDFDDVMDIWNLTEPLNSTDLRNMFGVLVKKIYNKIQFQSENNHKNVDKESLNKFWKEEFEENKQINNNCQKWINLAKHKIPNGQYPMSVCLVSFNQTIVAQIKDVININDNNFNSNSKKRRLNEINDEDNRPNKRRKLSSTSNINNYDTLNKKYLQSKQLYESTEKRLNEEIKSKKKLKNTLIIYKKENEELTKNNNELKKKLDLLELNNIDRLNLDKLNELKLNTLNKMKLIEEAEKELIDNRYKCVACMERPKNISFMDGCTHIALCDQCEAKLTSKVCPLCQTPYTNVRKLNF